MNPTNNSRHWLRGFFTSSLGVFITSLMLLGLMVGCENGTDNISGVEDPEGGGLVLAFPGAQGFGAQATGGRGGRVIKITNLNASGSGSLQEALDQDEPRIIVFGVSGVIEADPIEIEHGNVTIAGQTAPGAGITIKGRFCAAGGEGNIIVRHLRIRPEFRGEGGGSYDAIQLINSEQVIFDHVSVAFGVDETIGILSVQDVTIQWSTISMSATEGHPEGVHNYGLLSSRPRLSVHHNLFAHHSNRNPASSRGPSDVRNNVIYNFHRGFIHHNPPSGQFNITGNYYKQGPDGNSKPFYFDDSPGEGLAYYVANNYIDDPGDYLGIVDNPWDDSLYLDIYGSLGKGEEYRSDTEFFFADESFDYIPIITEEPQDAYEAVLERAGAWPRDVVTRTVVDETRQRSGEWGARIPDNLMDGLTVGTAPPDADNDGMADVWEQANGLDPTDGTDHNELMASGYTAIEEYINELADQLVPR